MMGLTGQGFASLGQISNEISSLPPAGAVAMGPIGGITPIAPMGQMMPSMGMPASVSMPQPLMSGVLPPTGTAAQAAGPTNPFLS